MSNININTVVDEKKEGYTNFIVTDNEYIEYETQVRCSNIKCREHKSLEQFHRKNNSEYGIQNECKECKRARLDNDISGIYKLSFDSLSEYIVEYYGNSSSLNFRLKNHLSMLKNTTHSNKNLQIQFNKLVKKIGLYKAISSIKFEPLVVLADAEKMRLIDVSENGKDHLSEYLYKIEKQVNNARIKEVKENHLNIKVVS